MTLQQVIQELEGIGFIADGQTSEQIARVPTIRSPIFGSIGGERRVFGGRSRYVLPGTTMRATVGIRTTNVYHVRGGTIGMILMEKTKDLDREQIHQAIAAAKNIL